MNTHARRGMAAVVATFALGTSLALGFLTCPVAPAGSAHADGDTVTVELPRCHTEDGSDIDGFCAWIDPDTGDVFINPTTVEMAR
jgi:hypothetical protein